MLTEDGYVPLDQLNLDDIKYVERLIDRNTTCPAQFTDALAFHRTALENKHANLNQAATAHG